MRPTGIYAENPALFKLVKEGSQFTKVAGGFGFTEGPVFSRIGFLRFTDLRSETIYQWTVPHWEDVATGGTLTKFRESSNRANGLTFDHQGRLLTGETGPGRVTRTEKDGSITVLADRWGDKRLCAPNDLVYNINGSVYFSDTPYSAMSEPEERTQKAAVYRIARTNIPGEAKLELASEECEMTNGVALGPKQNLLYLADSPARNIRVHEILEDGSLAKGRIFAEMESDEEGSADGLKTDELGNVYSTGPGGIWVYTAEGQHLGTLVPPEQPSNLNWGRGFRGLFVTARTSVYYIPTLVPGTRTF